MKFAPQKTLPFIAMIFLFSTSAIAQITSPNPKLPITTTSTLQNGDDVGEIIFQKKISSGNYLKGASIAAIAMGDSASYGMPGGLVFRTGYDNLTDQLYILNEGTYVEGPGLFVSNKIGIGTQNVDAYSSDFRLFVNGGILCSKLYIDEYQNWPDYVFGSDYDLMPLADLERFIRTHHHLPNVPSAEEALNDGINVGEMQRVLLEKIEELSLYIIEQNKNIEKLNEEVKFLKSQLD